MHNPILTDSFQRQFTYLRLSVTDACNFRCNYCLPDGYCSSHETPYLSLDEIKQVAAAFALNGIKKIRVTGGEPTLRKDLSEIIAACKNTDTIETLALTSNGYRIEKQLRQFVDAGLDQLNLSIDSLKPETFQLITGHDKLKQVLQGVDLALELGMKKVKINSVLMRENNAAELNHFLNFVKDRPLSLRFIELMETGENRVFFKQQHVSGHSIQTILEQQGWVQVLREAHAGPAVEYAHSDYAGTIGLIMPYSKNFCTTCNRLRVSSHGNLHLCLFAEQHHKLRPHLLEESPQALAERVRHLLNHKTASHDLHAGNSGSTQHLAMIGG